MRNVYVSLPDDAAQRLRELAQGQRRPPREQAAVLLIEAIEAEERASRLRSARGILEALEDVADQLEAVEVGGRLISDFERTPLALAIARVSLAVAARRLERQAPAAREGKGAAADELRKDDERRPSAA